MTISSTQFLAEPKTLTDKKNAIETSAQEFPYQKRQLSTAALFAGSKEVAIMHGADEYMLRITKQGKLILTK